MDSQAEPENQENDDVRSGILAFFELSRQFRFQSALHITWLIAYRTVKDPFRDRYNVGARKLLKTAPSISLVQHFCLLFGSS